MDLLKLGGDTENVILQQSYENKTAQIIDRLGSGQLGLHNKPCDQRYLVNSFDTLIPICIFHNKTCDNDGANCWAHSINDFENKYSINKIDKGYW